MLKKIKNKEEIRIKNKEEINVFLSVVLNLKFKIKSESTTIIV